MARGEPAVFLDTSVVITALLSSRGGSFHILSHYRDHLKFFINDYVLREALVVISRKFSVRAGLSSKLFFLIGYARVEVLSDPSSTAVKKASRVVEEEDAPILAGAVEKCDYLLTLDKGFLKESAQKFAGRRRCKIIVPRELVLNLRQGKI